MAFGSLRNKQEQLEYYDWLERHQQAIREALIRDVAAKYAADDHSGLPGGTRVPWYPSVSVASYVGPDATKPTVDLHEIILDVDPRIRGFARQIIAEAQIREQLGEMDEPYDD